MNTDETYSAEGQEGGPKKRNLVGKIFSDNGRMIIKTLGSAAVAAATIAGVAYAAKSFQIESESARIESEKDRRERTLAIN